MKKIVNWLGQTMEFEENLSSAIAKHEITNFPGEYIYEDDLFNISTDPEIPIKGYMILGISKQTLTITDLTKEERNRLIKKIKKFEIEISGFRKIEEAIITAGGINIKEINPKTMESKIIEGLYFAGEIIDVDAYTGGFNLQIAYSTGYTAGMNN